MRLIDLLSPTNAAKKYSLSLFLIILLQYQQEILTVRPMNVLFPRNPPPLLDSDR